MRGFGRALGVMLVSCGPNLHVAPLGLSTPVTVRVSRRDASSCWEARYSTAARNDAARFKASSD